MHACMYIATCMLLLVHVCTHMYMHAYTQVRVCANTCTRMHTHMFMYAQTHVHVCVRAFIYDSPPDFMACLCVIARCLLVRRTVTLMYAVLDGETGADFRWLFTAFMEMNGHQPPHVCFTDRDIAAEAAISMSWPDCEHYCCIWHLWGNLKKNLAGKLGPQYQVSARKCLCTQKLGSEGARTTPSFDASMYA